MRRQILAIAATLFVLGGVSSSVLAKKSSDVTIPASAEQVELVDVIDGDTFDARFLDGDDAGLTERIRMIGIDTPETSYSYGNHPECYGDEAHNKAESLLVASDEIWLERDITNDDGKGRLLRYVWIVSGIDGSVHFLNEDLVSDGYALAKTYKPNTTRQRTLDQAENAAIDASAGMWLTCDATVSGDHTQENPQTGPDTAPIDRTQIPARDDPEDVCSLFDSFDQAQEFLQR